MEEDKPYYCPNGHEYEFKGAYSDGDGDLYDLYHCYKCGYKAKKIIEVGDTNFYEGEFYEEFDEELFLDAAAQEMSMIKMISGTNLKLITCPFCKATQPYPDEDEPLSCLRCKRELPIEENVRQNQEIDNETVVSRPETTNNRQKQIGGK